MDEESASQPANWRRLSAARHSIEAKFQVLHTCCHPWQYNIFCFQSFQCIRESIALSRTGSLN